MGLHGPDSPAGSPFARTSQGLTPARTVASYISYCIVCSELHQVLEASFRQAEHELANMMLPRGNVITDAGDPDSVYLDLPDTINCEALPRPLEQAAGKPAHRGYKFIAAGLRSASGRVEILP